MRTHIITIFAAGLLVSTAAGAGPSSSSKSSGSSAGKSATSRSSTSSTTSSAGRSASRSSDMRAARNTATRNSAGSPARRSLLAGSPSQPSPKVTEIIRERERSGPGWLGTAFLVSLLSRHDLSSSDRSWIEGRINALRESGDDAEPAPALLSPAAPGVSFRYAGLQPQFTAGAEATVTVRAERAGVAVPVACTLPGAQLDQGRGEAHIEWTPAGPGVQLLACEAAGHHDRKLLRVAAANND